MSDLSPDLLWCRLAYLLGQQSHFFDCGSKTTISRETLTLVCLTSSLVSLLSSLIDPCHCRDQTPENKADYPYANATRKNWLSEPVYSSTYLLERRAEPYWNTHQ